MLHATIQFIKKDGQLVPASAQDTTRLQLFSMSIKEGEKLDVFLSVSSPADKSLGQLAKVHAMIREIARETGHTFDEIKDEVKRKAGLYLVTGTRSEDKEFKSFAECSKDELSKAIESCLEIGYILGYDLN